ncbi:MAG: cytochrome c oxidase assembly factor Coa1 family protein [Chthoniobacter sp.]|uniref:cytochrome c oxidase assembly factor Coa1 family protein n=1 Tax=Chthoniobacter sp. TaxID=2510640 RepID=UPI0032AC998D
MDSSTPPVPPAKKTNWWLIGCGGCLGLMVLALIGGGAIFMGVLKIIKSSGPYQTAVAGATASPEVQAELGTPIEPGFMPQGNVNTNDSGGTSTGTADLTIPLKGPKASGSLHYAATKDGGDWVVSDFTVTVEGSGKKIHVGP